jgi:predicted enzyme related to lactoylglutathione lyase
MANTFDWIEIRTHNLDTCARFYQVLFGLKITGKETVGGTDDRVSRETRK